MSDSNSSAAVSAGRPAKPPGSPLYPHPLGYWAKRVNSKLSYYGRWGRVVNGVVTPISDDEFPGYGEALAKFHAQGPAVAAGMVRKSVVPDKAPAPPEVYRVRDLCNEFIVHKNKLLIAGEIASRTFAEYRQATDRLIEFFGKDRPVDGIIDSEFDDLRTTMAKTLGPVRLGNEVVRIRSVFKHGRREQLVPATFKKPSAKALRKNRNTRPQRLFSAEEIRKLIAYANPRMKAMILLGINCGFGNSDISEIQKSNLDLDGGWVNFPRPKTEIYRRCHLWLETIAALRTAIATRPNTSSRSDAGCVFLTLHGNRYVREFEKVGDDGLITKVSQSNEVGVEFDRLFDTAKKVRSGVKKRSGISFYSLRHSHRTAADGAKDQVAANAIMGHVDPSMAAVYREHIDDERLVVVSEHVHSWLYGA